MRFLALSANEVTGSVDLSAPPEQVWIDSTDTTRWPRWTEGTLEVMNAPDLLALGSGYQEINVVLGPWRTTTTWEVVGWSPSKLHEHRGVGLPFLEELIARFELDETDAGTRFTMTFRYVPRGRLGRVACIVLLNSRLRRSLDRSLARVAAGGMAR